MYGIEQQTITHVYCNIHMQPVLAVESFHISDLFA